MDFFFAVYNTVLQCCLMWLRAFFPHCYQICPSIYVDALLQSDYNLPYMPPPLPLFTRFFLEGEPVCFYMVFPSMCQYFTAKMMKEQKKNKREREKKMQ